MISDANGIICPKYATVKYFVSTTDGEYSGIIAISILPELIIKLNATSITPVSILTTPFLKLIDKNMKEVQA